MKLRIATPNDIDVIQALRLAMLKEVADAAPLYQRIGSEIKGNEMAIRL